METAFRPSERLQQTRLLANKYKEATIASIGAMAESERRQGEAGLHRREGHHPHELNTSKLHLHYNCLTRIVNK